MQTTQVETLFAKERPRPRLDQLDLSQRKQVLTSLHEMNFDEDALRRAVKDLVHKFTEEKTLE